MPHSLMSSQTIKNNNFKNNPEKIGIIFILNIDLFYFPYINNDNHYQFKGRK